ERDAVARAGGGGPGLPGCGRRRTGGSGGRAAGTRRGGRAGRGRGRTAAASRTAAVVEPRLDPHLETERLVDDVLDRARVARRRERAREPRRREGEVEHVGPEL